ncbi:hypothetical protein EV182_003043 [Spiromyces aspiralis]|uniref:Uncharacterized protein n=1 Tax=Spiromyces aspiralis TaxID=68401 RepID=A0ACC1HD72_9FUNG|nr:hypothetical protein EV182_003043 [Spiromyces aspiralis]
MPSLNMPMKLVEHFAELWASYRNLVATLRQMRANDLQATSQDISAMYDPTSMPSSSLGAPLNVHQAQSMLNVDVNSCLAQDERGCFLYDLYTLLSLLRRSEQELELNGGIVSEGARTRVRLAIRTIMIAAFYSNQERDLFFAFSKAMNSWREVAEILVTSAWDAMGSKGDPSNMRVPLDLLSELLRVFIEASDELDSQQQEGAEMSVDGDGGALTSQDALGADFATRYDIVLTALSPALVLLTDKLQQGWLAAGSRQQLQQQAASGTNRTINNLSGMGGAAAGLSSGSQIPTEKHLAIWKSLISAALSPPAQRELPLRGNIYAAILHYLNGLRTIATKQTATDTVSSGAGGRYSLQKVARHQLLLGAVEILTSSSMGDRLLESLCQDAADAWDAWKTVAFSLLDGLANLYSYESRSRIVMFMTQRNYFAQYVGSLRREDDALQQTLDENPATLNPLYIYEAKMAFFIRLAQRRDGAEKLMENGIVEVLTDCKFLDSRIASVGAAITGALGSEAFIPSYFERYHQLFIPAINLMSLLATKVGKDNVTTLMKFAYFVTQHYAALEGILKQTIQAACSQIAVDGGVTGDLGYQQYQHQHQQQALAPSLTTYLLAQAKAVTTLVLHVSRHQVVVDRERSTAASGGVGIVTLHPYMMALLPKFGYSNKWANNLTPINETERLQAQVDVLNLYELSDKSGLPASISVSSSAVPLPSTLFTKLADDTVQTIVRNVLTYAQFTSESTNAHNPLAFWPAFVPTMGHARISDFMPSLATLVELMRFYVDRINQYSACLIEASRKLAGINQLTNAELKALLTGAPLEDVDSMTSAEIKDSVPGYLRSYQAEVRTKLASAYTSVQMATLLLWRHLDAFLEPVGGDSWAERPAESGFASDYQHQQQRPRYLGGMPEPSLQEREALHSDAIITLPSLLNSLSNINFDIPTATDEKLQAASVTSLQDNNQSALLRMLVRRIKDMVLRDESDIGL